MPLVHRGFSAWILCDGEQLVEQEVVIDEFTNQVSCRIPASAGKKFIVCWQDHASGVDTCSYIVVDGLCVPGRFLTGSGIAIRSGVRTSDTTERPFVFRDVHDDGSQTGGVLKDEGKVVLKIKRVRLGEAQHSAPLKPLPVLGKRKIGQVSPEFGEQEYAFLRQPTTYKLAPYESGVPPGSKPLTFVTFIFRYGPPGSLPPETPPAFPHATRLRVKTQEAPTSLTELDLQRIDSDILSYYIENPPKRQKLDNSSSPPSPGLANGHQPSASPAVHESPKVSTPGSDIAPINSGSPSPKGPTAPGTKLTKNQSPASTSRTSTMSPDALPSPVTPPPGPLAANPYNPYMYMYGPAYLANAGQPGFPPLVYSGVGMPYNYVSPGQSLGFNSLFQPQNPITLPYTSPAYFGTLAASGSATQINDPSTGTVARRPTAPPVTHPVNNVPSTSTRATSQILPPNAGRISAENKRAASWAAESSSPTVASGPYSGQFQFFLPAGSLHSST